MIIDSQNCLADAQAVTATAGKFDAFIAAGTQRNVAKASGFTVQ